MFHLSDRARAKSAVQNPPGIYTLTSLHPKPPNTLKPNKRRQTKAKSLHPIFQEYGQPQSSLAHFLYLPWEAGEVRDSKQKNTAKARRRRRNPTSSSGSSALSSGFYTPSLARKLRSLRLVSGSERAAVRSASPRLC